MALIRQELSESGLLSKFALKKFFRSDVTKSGHTAQTIPFCLRQQGLVLLFGLSSSPYFFEFSFILCNPEILWTVMELL